MILRRGVPTSVVYCILNALSGVSAGYISVLYAGISALVSELINTVEAEVMGSIIAYSNNMCKLVNNSNLIFYYCHRKPLNGLNVDSDLVS